MIPITHPFRKLREKDGAPGLAFSLISGATLHSASLIPVTHFFRKLHEKDGALASIVLVFAAR